MANFDHFGSRIPDAWSLKLIFSLIVTFYLTKTENRTTSSHTITSSKGTILAKKR